jgi:hypothetical protein
LDPGSREARLYHGDSFGLLVTWAEWEELEATSLDDAEGRSPRRRAVDAIVKQLIERFGEREVGERLDEMVHDMKGEEAAGINNSGLHAQVEYLSDGRADWILDALERP